ncbi:MAG: class I SAM-dependent methyltransferase [Bacteroidaceae bacterium]|nr:class I SAM-dependent methyltransferase [Bacteroidaceae bacterium]
MNVLREQKDRISRMLRPFLSIGTSIDTRWLTHFNFKNDDKVLNVGCGKGEIVSRLLDLVPDGHVTGLDRSYEMANTASSRNNKAIKMCRCMILTGSARSMNFANNCFDKAVISDDVDSWDEPQRTFEEIRRVVKPGGKLIICYNKTDRNGSDANLESYKETIRIIEAAGYKYITTEKEKTLGHFCIVAES